MFCASLPSTPYADPWMQSYSVRLQMLCTRKLRIAYYYESANNSTFRYRAYNMAQVLNADATGGISASYFFQSDTEHVSEIANQADLLVICRSGYNHVINQWITQFKSRGKTVLFDVDDLVFDTAYTHLLINTLGLDAGDSQVWEDWFAMTSRMGATLRMCDGAITTNHYLGECIEQFAQKSASVVPNFMNQEQVELSKSIWERKLASGFVRNEQIHLGYFSGSPSHRLDFALLESALAAVMESDSRIHLTLVGYIEAGPTLTPFGNRIQRHPFQDYLNLQRLVASVEFNLMPLQSNVFTNCKSELKYFESAAVGSVSIASPSVNYGACIKHAQNGYIARAHSWARVINQAVSSLSDYPDMALLAHQDAMSRYTWSTQLSTILSGLGLN